MLKMYLVKVHNQNRYQNEKDHRNKYVKKLILTIKINFIVIIKLKRFL